MNAKKSGKIIGRARERKVLLEALRSPKSEVYCHLWAKKGRKNLSHQELILSRNCVFLHTAGIQNGTLMSQLGEFAKQIGVTFYGEATISTRASWLDTLEELTKAISQISTRKKVVIFLDELPWLATKRSRLLEALDYYWNRYWVHDGRIKLVVCGSASSWIIDNIINNKGGLYLRRPLI